MRSLVGLGALAVLLVGGCSAPAPEAPAQPPTPPAVANPVSISIPKLGAESDLMYLGRDATGALEVPPVEHPEVAGWFAGDDIDEDGDETKPGQRGSAVVAAHVDGRGPDGQPGFPGLFAHLSSLVPGDEVLVEQEGGTTLRFVVESVEAFEKVAFPGERVYLRDDAVRLNLVTCGGSFDEKAGHYVDNVVAFTKLAPDTAAGGE
ncbi:sortase domain-containing protein [Pseudonocardia adelaidensis]|uniref:Sortase family protein n=1 Tax=Pseudonocardia adelaidensis TaxID=648754 RepID=A0ABP9NWK7_9PSEU